MSYQYLLTRDGTSIAYRHEGEGSAIVFVHGFPFDSTSWQPQFDEFSKKYQTIIYDQRGFGKSERGSGELSMKQFADDLADVMDALALQDAVVCGLSMGGYVLLNFIQHYPQKVKGLVLCDTQCKADSAEAKQGRSASQELIRSGGRNEFTEKFISKLFAEDSVKKNPELVENIRTVISQNNNEVIIDALSALAAREEACHALSELKFPVLLMGGKEDVITPPQLLDDMKTIYPLADIQLIPKAGHLSNLEQPEKFNTHLKNFLKRL